VLPLWLRENLRVKDLMQTDACTIYRYLQQQNLLADAPQYWWPNAGSFEVIVGAVLTQNTTWKNVEKSLKNLEGFLTLESFITLDEELLKSKIKPSGFYNQKAPRLLTLANNIKKSFSTFEIFQKNVTRNWLLEQKGIGQESADAILCYGCFRAEMVIDTYTKRLLQQQFDLKLKTYDEYKSFFEEGLRVCFDQTQLFEAFASLHGMIVEYNKAKKL